MKLWANVHLGGILYIYIYILCILRYIHDHSIWNPPVSPWEWTNHVFNAETKQLPQRDFLSSKKRVARVASLELGSQRLNWRPRKSTSK